MTFGYRYEGEIPFSHQPKMIYSPSYYEDMTLLGWDANGQMTSMLQPYQNRFRRHWWDETGQLAAAIGNEYCGYYGYNANSEHVYKLTGTVLADQYNAGDVNIETYFDDMVLYVNPYMVVTPQGYTKHYYNGSERIAARLGDYWYDVGAMVDEQDRMNLAREVLDDRMNSTEVEEEYLDDEIYRSVDGEEFYVEPYVLRTNYMNCIYDEDMLYDVFNGGRRQSDDMSGIAEGIFYYHPDHLGSASWITDDQGQAVQYIHYMPYGELWTSVQAFDYEERFKFTGKERDSETGYDYFGARYYLSLLGIWLSPDPLLDKYPSISSYAYCKWNPLKYMDPNGKLVWPVLPKYNGYGRRHENNFGAPRPNGRTHAGVDINHTGGGNTDLGAPIIATHDGVVVSIKTIGNGDKDAGGNRITITSEDGSVATSYMHLDVISNGIQEGSIVQEGQQIGTMGGSGKGVSDRYTSHLHYELRIDGQLVNPAISPSELIDPQRLIEKDIEGGTLPEILVVGEKQNRPIPNLNIE